MAPFIQVSLDVTTIEEALSLAHEAVDAGVDWLEAGTPLLLAQGYHAVQALHQTFPNTPIVADIKCMDGGYGEAAMMFKAGASMVVVMGQAHDATLLEALRAAKHYTGKVMCDIMNCPDKAERASALAALGADYIIVHTGFDERHMHTDRTPLADLPNVLAAVTIPVQAVGGLSIEQALSTIEMGANSVVFGAPLVVGNGGARADSACILREIVARVKGKTAL